MPNLMTLHDISGRLIVVEAGSPAEANARMRGYKDANFLTTDDQVEAAKAQVAQQEAAEKAETEAAEKAAKEKASGEDKTRAEVQARADAKAKADEAARNANRTTRS